MHFLISDAKHQMGAALFMALLMATAVTALPAQAQGQAPLQAAQTASATPIETAVVPGSLADKRQANAEAGTTAAAQAPAKTALRAKPIHKTAKPAAPLDQAAPIITGSVAKTAAAAGAVPAAATKLSGRCTRMAFEVNDWGKEGPTADAKTLLDKHVATWAAGKGIKKYTIGKKVVNCRLFLDFGFADEHTCRAEAPVCW